MGDGLFLFNSWLFWVLVVVWTADDLAYLKNPIWWTGMVTSEDSHRKIGTCRGVKLIRFLTLWCGDLSDRRGR